MTFKEELMDETQYIPYYKFLLFGKPKDTNKYLLLSILIDGDSFASNRLVEDALFFECTDEFIYRYGIKWSRNTLEGYFKSLEKEGLIYTKRMAKPHYNYPPRYVKLNYQKLTDMYQKFNNDCQFLKNISQNLIINKNYKEELNNTNIYTLKGDKSPLSVKNTNIKNKYGKYNNVLLSDDELSKLKDKFPSDWEDRIDDLDLYCQSTGKTYKDYLATIMLWSKTEKPKRKLAKRKETPKKGNDDEYKPIDWSKCKVIARF